MNKDLPFQGDTLKAVYNLLPTVSMYKKQEKDVWGSLVTAGLGAGIITSLAVAQGQSPWVAIAITLFAASVAVIIDQLMS